MKAKLLYFLLFVFCCVVAVFGTKGLLEQQEAYNYCTDLYDEAGHTYQNGEVLNSTHYYCISQPCEQCKQEKIEVLRNDTNKARE